MTSREDDLEYAIVCARNSLAATAALLEELAQDVALGESGEYHGASLEELLTAALTSSRPSARASTRN